MSRRLNFMDRPLLWGEDDIELPTRCQAPHCTKRVPLHAQRGTPKQYCSDRCGLRARQAKQAKWTCSTALAGVPKRWRPVPGDIGAARIEAQLAEHAARQKAYRHADPAVAKAHHVGVYHVDPWQKVGGTTW